MKSFAIGVTLVAALVVIGLSPVSAQSRWSGVLTRSQMRAYHACLYETWIQHRCSWISPYYAYNQCVFANRGGRFPAGGNVFTDSDCWFMAQGLPRYGLYRW
jgi:hypothetical protein